MNSEQVTSQLDAHEGATLEFKKSLRFADNVARTLCAFANSVGGLLVAGVERKDGRTTIHGMADPDAEDQHLAQILAQLNPKPYVQTHRFSKDGKTLLAISVNPIPVYEVCFFKKSIYRRIGSTNTEVAGKDIVAFLRHRGTVSFEDNRSGAVMQDISGEKVRALLKNRGTQTKEHEPLKIQSILASLGTANTVGEFFLKNSAVLFFAEDITKFHMNVEVRIVRFRGRKKTLQAREYDERLVDTLPELLSRTFQTVREKAGSSGRIVEGKRVQAQMVPEEVLREALTNAVGHRDYFDPNGIVIEIYDDRIEISNPGGLLPGLTLQNFAEVRKARNPVTYRLLNDSQWGESLNLGIKTMYRGMRQNNLPDPEFQDMGGMFKVTLFGPLSGRKARPFGQLNDRQEKAVAHLQKHPSITAPQLAKLAKISHPTAIRDLNDLVAQGTLSKTGRYRSSRYMLEKIKL